MDLVTIGSGIAGLLFFEFLRIYKCTTVGKHPVPNNRLGWHLFGLGGLALIAALLAVQFAKGEFIEGMVLGFSVPSGIKAVLTRESPTDTGDDRWLEDADADIEMGSQRRIVGFFKDWIESYFDR